MIVVLNAIIAACCFAVGGIEFSNWHVPGALAYCGFGIGYIGLTWLYASIS